MKGNILVIEDDKDWQANLKLFLEVAGYNVEVVNSLTSAQMRLQSEVFQFITIDMQLDENNNDAQSFEGWAILDTIRKLGIQDTTPAMVITGFGSYYKDLKQIKNVNGLFFMEKGEFDRKTFLEIVRSEITKAQNKESSQIHTTVIH